jgi:hypothetical protein
MLSVKEFTYVDKSNDYHGIGVFSCIDMPIGTLLSDICNNNYHNYILGDEIVPFSFTVLINDKNMKYPPTWSTNDIFNSLKSYENDNLCNVEETDDNIMKVIRDIKKGDELTKKYGVLKWIKYFYHDIVGRNPFNWQPKLVTDQLIQSLKNLSNTIENLGYGSINIRLMKIMEQQMKMDPKIDLTELIYKSTNLMLESYIIK